MAITATAGKKLAEQEAVRRSARAGRFSITPLFGVRARQIALITLFVVAVISVTTIANIAYLTGVIINGTEKQASQLSDQITYAIQRELAHEILDYENPYIEIAKEQSEVRGLMESIIATSKPILYLYLTDANGEIITDADGKLKLAVNQHTIGDTSATPDI